MDTFRDELAEGRGDIAVLWHHALDQLKGLAGEVPGRSVIGDAEPRALYPLILGRLVEVGERQGPLDRLRQPADADSLVVGADIGCRNQCRESDKHDR